MDPVFVTTAARDVTVVRFECDLDLATCRRAAAELIPLTTALGYDCVVIDMSGRFVCARGLQVLADAVTAAAHAGRSWAVAGLSRTMVRRVARHWYPQVPMHLTQDEAVRALLEAHRLPTRATNGRMQERSAFPGRGTLQPDGGGGTGQPGGRD
jgi:anti-anti-sigma regulatory factor